MDIVGQWLTGLVTHFVLLAWLQLPRGQILVLQASEVDVGMEQSTWTFLQHCDLFVIDVYRSLLFYTLAATATFEDLLTILHFLLLSQAFKIWIFSQKQTLLSIWKYNPYSHL